MNKTSDNKTKKGKTRSSKAKSSPSKNLLPESLSKEIIGLCIIGISLLILIGLFIENSGILGQVMHTIFSGLLGIGGYMLPLVLLILGVFYMQGYFKKAITLTYYSSSLILLIISLFHVISFGSDTSHSLISIYYIEQATWFNGGWLGAALSYMLLKLIGLYGTYVFLILLICIWCIITTKIPLFSWLSEKISLLIQDKREQQKRNKNLKEVSCEKPVVDITLYDSDYIEISSESPIIVETESELIDTQASISPIVVAEEELDTIESCISTKENLHTYHFPSIELLTKGQVSSNKDASKKSITNAKKLEETLASFGVEAKVLQIHRGPSVTRYELQPKQGVKVSKIVNLADDIALNLAAPSIRIEAPIPGKSAVGIEIANDTSEMVYLRDVIDTDRFLAFPSKLAFALGKDIAGKPIIADIAKMPHILIAGATGSGKSVCINTLIASILYKAKPEEVKLIMIDPKVVELSVYNGIPHLLIPVVTDPKKAAGALWWAVNEMTKRYNQFAENNVRDMKGYNEKVLDEAQKLPQIVIIIDELADLMMTAAKEVEDAICRLAQMARAAGIHLVIATQRPSVDVITGVIKANIPSRLAFAVSSGTDSRTILDTNGAEKLLGKGDMLFNPIGESKPIRIQGAFISDKEVESIVKSIKTEDVVYEESVIQTLETSHLPVSMEDEEDELVEKAIAFSVGKEKLSISMLQRYFRIGFNRAARLMDTLESKGIVGPDEGSKPRKVL